MFWESKNKFKKSKSSGTLLRFTCEYVCVRLNSYFTCLNREMMFGFWGEEKGPLIKIWLWGKGNSLRSLGWKAECQFKRNEHVGGNKGKGGQPRLRKGSADLLFRANFLRLNRKAQEPACDTGSLHRTFACPRAQRSGIIVLFVFYTLWTCPPHDFGET